MIVCESESFTYACLRSNLDFLWRHCTKTSTIDRFKKREIISIRPVRASKLWAAIRWPRLIYSNRKTRWHDNQEMQNSGATPMVTDARSSRRKGFYIMEKHVPKYDYGYCVIKSRARSGAWSLENDMCLWAIGSRRRHREQGRWQAIVKTTGTTIIARGLDNKWQLL